MNMYAAQIRYGQLSTCNRKPNPIPNSLLGKYYHRRNGHWSNYYFNKLHISIIMENNNDNTDTHSKQTNKQECFIQGIKLVMLLFISTVSC